GDNSWDANDQFGFSPIGNNGTRFTGNYNGQNHTISNLYINRTSFSYIGLFGRTGSSSTVSNIGLLDIYVSGNDYVGGLVGLNSYGGGVSGSYSTGNVSASGSEVGGLVGGNYGGGVSDSYSTGSVSGNNSVGGLVGDNYGGSVSGSYSTGSVSGNGDVGGLVGRNYGGSIIDSYWDMQTSGQSSSAGGTGMHTDSMKVATNFSGWDFTGTWNIQDGSSHYSYPYLRAFTYDTPGDPAVNPIPGLEQKYSGGDGTSGTPYQISTTADLIELSNTSSDWTGKYFIQTADIAFDASESTVDWDGNGTVEWSGNDQYGFSPIGNNDTSFTGSYNGQNHTISNLYIKRASIDYIGLFGRTGSGSTVSNIGLLDVYVSGQVYAGGLVGFNGGSVSGNYSTGSVSGNGDVGGLVGFNGGSISDSYWDMQTSGRSTSAGGTGMHTDSMKVATNFSGWNFSTTWNIQDGSSYYSYPYLRAFTYDTPGDPAVNPIPGLFKKKYSGGFGTVGYPYQISTTDDLIELSNTSSDWTGKYFIQTANISFDASESTVDWDGNGTVEWSGNDQLGFSPIGNDGTEFTGSYNGQNHTISNLSCFPHLFFLSL
ncbi:MAG TPA: GLUG motif-containing protein, partial [Candidatus Kapabacteria bacterium]|nr:GLUG motif-containing protein [Candidatus Kapabacteria bacterium]